MFNVRNDQPLAQAIVDTVREPLLVLDADLRVVVASRSFYTKFRVRPESVEGKLLQVLGDGQWDISKLRDRLMLIAPDGEALEGFEVDLTFPEIGRRVMLLNARKVFYARGAHATILLAFEDITDRSIAELERKRLVSEKDMLFEEMQHRVANSLQIIASILLLKARRVDSDETRAHLHEAHERVLAVAAVQKHLRATSALDVEIRPYLTQLCESLARSMVGDRTIAIELQADDAVAKSSDAVGIGLIVTELVINALKHAFPSDKKDSLVDVAYAVTASGWRLSVSDNGVGTNEASAPGRRKGLGGSIIEALANQLDARVARVSEGAGLCVSITHDQLSSVIALREEATPGDLAPALMLKRSESGSRFAHHVLVGTAPYALRIAM